MSMNDRIAQWFADSRRAFRLTQVEVATRMGITQGQVSHLERGLSTWTPSMQERACRAFGLPERQMFEALARAA